MQFKNQLYNLGLGVLFCLGNAAQADVLVSVTRSGSFDVLAVYGKTNSCVLTNAHSNQLQSLDQPTVVLKLGDTRPTAMQLTARIDGAEFSDGIRPRQISLRLLAPEVRSTHILLKRNPKGDIQDHVNYEFETKEGLETLALFPNSTIMEVYVPGQQTIAIFDLDGEVVRNGLSYCLAGKNIGGETRSAAFKGPDALGYAHLEASK